MVEVTPDEVFALVDRLEARLDPTELALTRERAVEIDRRGRTLPAEERHLLRLFCPVLDRASGDCRAHEVRPIACRAICRSIIGAAKPIGGHADADPEAGRLGSHSRRGDERADHPAGGRWI